MSTRRIILMLLLSLSIGFAGGAEFGRQQLSDEVQQVIEECTSEVSKGCPLLYQYVSDLERENSRLNMLLKIKTPQPDTAGESAND
tara:strand:+ start:209 stop:466 length:258 start_codon:yes stop_codon:yes gene_type:complete